MKINKLNTLPEKEFRATFYNTTFKSKCYSKIENTINLYRIHDSNAFCSGVLINEKGE